MGSNELIKWFSLKLLDDKRSLEKNCKVKLLKCILNEIK